jgi:hypothetical protein
VPVGSKQKVRTIAVTPMPFFVGGSNKTAASPIEYRSADQMTKGDRELESNAEGSIAERAKFADLNFDEGNWTYHEVVCCPALPNHIFLRFLRNNGAGDASMFTASIPRAGDGLVRIIPIQRRGYSLFSPAPIAAMTVSAFNHIRSEENPGNAAQKDWVGTGLCYAALAGGDPKLAAPTDQPTKDNPPLASEAFMTMPQRGGPTISFDDAAVPARPIEWTMGFDSKGKLLKVTRSNAGRIKTDELQPKSEERAWKSRQNPTSAKVVEFGLEQQVLPVHLKSEAAPGVLISPATRRDYSPSMMR